MTQEQRKQYSYTCAEQGNADCDYKFAGEDSDEMRDDVQRHYEQAHMPEDLDPRVVDELIEMQRVQV